MMNEVLNPIHGMCSALLLLMGLRKTEALTLDRNDMYNDHIHLPMTANGRSSVLPVTQAHQELRAQLHPRSVGPATALVRVRSV